jgi:hypothetical protein
MSTAAQKSRQARAQAQLEKQLKLGTKNTKDGEVKLTDKDIKRINTEIDNLKKKQ